MKRKKRDCVAQSDRTGGEETEPPGQVPVAICEPPPPIRRMESSPNQLSPGHSPASRFRKSVSNLFKSERSAAFAACFFPNSKASNWNDWRWQLRNRVRTPAELKRMIRAAPEEEAALSNPERRFPFAITPYYASLIDSDDPQQPLRRCVVPCTAEGLHGPGEEEDPLGEDGQSPAPGLVHRYPDRVLFLVTDFCSTYCRYCTRSRMVGHGGPGRNDVQTWQRALDYIERTPSVRDVLISGGDPLTLRDEQLEWLLSRLRRIPHVQILRIGSKVPAVLPQRITPTLTRMLRKYHPLWMSLHFTHPDEVTPETTEACERLADAGIPLGSQTVLLRGVNDDIDTMRRLFHGLMMARVRPYYLYQCDPIVGSTHFRTSVQKGLEILEGLRGHTTGYAVPHYVIDAPGGGGKIALVPNAVLGREGRNLLLRNYQGHTCRYPDVI